MHRTQQHICELDYCGRPSPDGWICPQCKADTQEWLDHITKDHLQDLLLIARREMQPATYHKVNAKSNQVQDALNVAVWSLWHDLAHKWPDKIQHLHRNKHAVDLIGEIQAGVTTALRLTEGEDEQAVDDEYIQKRMAQIFPMRPKDMIPYLKEHLGIRVSRQSINNWRVSGKLEPRLINSEGHKFYHPADILRAIDNDRRHDYKRYLYINANT